MSNTILKLPASISSITINGNVKNADGNQEITVDSADVATAIKQSHGMNSPCIVIGISKPPINPAT